MYNYKDSKSNIVNILTSKTKIEKKDKVPKEQEFTFENDIRAWVGAIFVDIIGSSSLVEFDKALQINNLKPKQQLIWNKNSLVLGRQDYQWKHECIAKTVWQILIQRIKGFI